MGNRAVITTRENFDNNGIGIYLHWNGGRDSVEPFLKYCELKGFRAPTTDCYGFARLAQVIGNFFGGGLSLGIDTVDRLDCDNYDNGVYIIDGWEIVDREYFDDRTEQQEYDLMEMLESINEAQPEKEQLPKELFEAVEIPQSEVKIRDTILYLDSLHSTWVKEKVVGIGKDDFVNGHNVLGIPYIDKYGTENPAKNINNYLMTETVKALR